MTVSYDEWSQLLADFFFDEAHDENDVLFAVDPTTLAEILDDNESVAVRNLSDAVAVLVMPGFGFRRIRRKVIQWRASGASGPHPGLPLLALTVLAASRMGESTRFAAHNYYVPLRRLLDPSDAGRGAPGNFTDHIEYLWKDLAIWANEDLEGKRGRLTVRDPGRLRFIGLAMQHALVRSSVYAGSTRFSARSALHKARQCHRPSYGALYQRGSRGEPTRGLGDWIA